MTVGQAAANRDLLLPYLLPYLAYVVAAEVGRRSGAEEVGYLLRIVATTAALAWAWPRLGPFRGPRSPAASAALGVPVGLAATALWIALLQPFVPAGAEPWPERTWWLRLVAAGALTPVFEELFLTGFVLRFLVQWDRLRGERGARGALDMAFEERSVARLEPGAWTPLAVALTAVVFALGHSPAEYPAALAYSLLMSSLWIARGDLVTCMAAHATTNVALALFVRATGHWELW